MSDPARAPAGKHPARRWLVAMGAVLVMAAGGVWAINAWIGSTLSSPSRSIDALETAALETPGVASVETGQVSALNVPDPRVYGQFTLDAGLTEEETFAAVRALSEWYAAHAPDYWNTMSVSILAADGRMLAITTGAFASDALTTRLALEFEPQVWSIDTVDGAPVVKLEPLTAGVDSGEVLLASLEQLDSTGDDGFSLQIEWEFGGVVVLDAGCLGEWIAEGSDFQPEPGWDRRYEC